MLNIDWTNDEVVNEFLRNGLLLANQPQIEERQAFNYSDKYKRWEARFLASPFRFTKKKSKPVWQKSLQTAAAVLVVAVLTFGAVLVVNPDVRAAFYNWFVEHFQTHDTYRFTGEPDGHETREWKPSWLPEGYVEVDYIELTAMTIIRYENETGIEIELDYAQMNEGGLFNLDNEDMIINHVFADGILFTSYQSSVEHKANAIIWTDEKNNMMFMLISFEPCEKLLQIAASIK